MPTRSFVADRSSLLAVTGSTELGGGQDDHLPIGGPWQGYTFRGVVRFVLDWSSVKKINSATLILRTSSAVHVAFSSAPDIYVARATSSWSPNSASSSSEGGSGWSTSPVVYPGPSSTTSGRATKRMPTSEGTSVSIDITAIVRAWAPTSVAGGGAAANYGILLYYVASGDITEVNSYTNSSGKPSITLDYSTDAPPTAVATGPTGTTTSKRPTITGTGSDPDGDAITSYGIEVKQGATVVHSATAGSGATLSYVPTADLPSGSLTVHIRATAAGVTGAWSADLPFVIDRLPTVTGWTAPAASVSGTRRPVHTFTWTDADGDVGEFYDIEVYQDAGGGALGAKVGGAAGIAVPGGTSPVSWTPTADLPGGALLARSRIRTRGAWSVWSANRAFTVVLTVPTLTWFWPEYDGGWVRVRTFELLDGTVALANMSLNTFSIDYRPPSGTTIDPTKTTFKTEVDDPGIGGPAVGTVLATGTFGAIPAGGTYMPVMRPATFAANWISGTIKITLTIVAANGGQTVEIRRARFAYGEWFGAVALGDQVSGLIAAAVVKGIDDVGVLYRAQSSPTVAAGGSVWSTVAAAIPLLPATNAYLGIRPRLSRRQDDTDLVVNGGFESGLNGWTQSAWVSWINVAPSGGPGGACLRITGNGVANYPSSVQSIPVIPGASYLFTGWGRAAGATTNGARLRVDLYNPADTVSVTAGVVNVVLPGPAQGLWLKAGPASFTVPADGSVGFAHVLVYIDAAAATAAQLWDFDGISLQGLAPGDAGLDRLDLAWTSLG